MAVFLEIFRLTRVDRCCYCLDYVFLPNSLKMNHARSFLIYWLPVLLYIALIFGLSSASSVPGAAEFNDKILHATEYAVLAFLLWRAFSRSDPGFFPWQRAGIILVAGSICGALDEFYQSFTPGRFSSIYDWHADVAGIVGMTTLLYLRYKYRSNRGRSYESI
jgi:VanZ like family